MTDKSFANIFDAAGSGSVEDVKYFIEEQCVDVNEKHHHWGRTPLHFAAVSNTVEVLQ
jgi:hypothetical protein